MNRNIPQADPMLEALQIEFLESPRARVGLPVQMLSLVVLNANVDLTQECAHLAKLSGQKDLTVEVLASNFLRVQAGPCSLRWERDTEFTRYTIMRALPPSTLLNDAPQQLVSQLLFDPNWIEKIPGKTLLAIHLVALAGEPPNAINRATAYDHWFAEGVALGSMMGSPTHSSVVTDFALQHDGFERMLILAKPGISEARLGRVAQQLLEIETYRILALRGFPLAQNLLQLIVTVERELVSITGQIKNPMVSEQVILEALASVTTLVESAITENQTILDASKAYYQLITRRLGELNEMPLESAEMFGTFMLRRLSHAMDTITSTSLRLNGLSKRTAQAVTLLRVRTHISYQKKTEELQVTVSNVKPLISRLHLSVTALIIAAISYFIMRFILGRI